jgi:ParB/RepB/Spo0J family partition protein
MERIIEIPRDRIRPFANQPHEYFDQAALKDLARSIKAIGLQNPVAVRPIPFDTAHDYELIDGQRRWLACGINHQKTIRAFVRDDIADQNEQFLVSIVSNFCREDHTPMEIAKAIARLRKTPKIAALERETQAQAMADCFGRSSVWIYSYETLLRLHPRLQELLDPALPESQRLSTRVAQMLSKLPVEEQIPMHLKVEKKGLPREKALIVLRKLIAKKATGSDGRKIGARGNIRMLSALTAIAENLESLLKIKLVDFDRIFSARPFSEQESLLFRIDEGIEQLKILRQTLARIMKARAA